MTVNLTTSSKYDTFFLHQEEEGIEAFTKLMDQVSEKLQQVYADTTTPFIGKNPKEIEEEIKQIMHFPVNMQDSMDVLNEIEWPILKNSLHISHPKSMAHLHCPPLLPGIAAELIIAVLNQSMDSWDQSTAATYVENEMVKWLTDKVYYPPTAGGVFTSGGTQSNYMGLLLARDAFCHSFWNHNVQLRGLPADFHRLRIICSEDAHFTVQKAASQLGLGEQSVITVKTDEKHRMIVSEVEEKIDLLKEQDLLPFALVATCGTTDFGSIDPLKDLGVIAREQGIWLHVDAAYGGGLMLSHSNRDKLNGLENADSMTVDLHKLFFQPISCGAFLVKDQQHFRHIAYHADYLNPLNDEEEGILNLVNKSVQTTRRFDALKLFLSLKMVGTHTFGQMIDDTLTLASYTAGYMKELENIVIKNPVPEINTIIFRYQPRNAEKLTIDLCEINRSIQQALLHSGKGVIAKTSVNGKTFLKLTLLNPRTKQEDIHSLLTEIETMGAELINGGLQS
ncbi:aspartate aminotransferase family protein [Jeotgalibacillus sp. S-D1]|uniref:pyridoxal phosphate-dependent decarboxylase family protein n=1 Tax=Jeotgalibacillus sp. S-D1 TaxID=2552189 RepID=UPI00105AA785|nr:aspartate aminotransferase family protein [Jeotgalibacillus sp. S-D1]TDL34183.1 aspartate aminotransferase family protein [Jeotgalibacillus sp. S-D1]